MKNLLENESDLGSHPVFHGLVQDDQSYESISSESIPTHPLGIKPLGNLYLSQTPNARRNAGSLQALPDELLMPMFEFLDKTTLLRLSSTCKFLHAFCRSDELWKPLFIKSYVRNPRQFQWLGTWRRTLLKSTGGRESSVDCSNVYSDVLHRPFACTYIDLSKYVHIPESNQIQRFPDLSYAEFAARWSSTPFILTKCIQSWPAFGSWDISSLREKYAGVDFRAEAVDWPFSTYCDYLYNNVDESPLYLFDRKFAENMGINIGRENNGEYWKPDCFGPDLFELLGDDRPAHRWLIIGPKRSGSTFHKDPNATSAWNAVLQGAKYWIMFPPNVSVPGVYVSEDSSEVTSPLSIAEWLLEFHADARSIPECLEGICREGEILHVPSGWWHLVVNLENSIAITQNFVPKSHLSSVIEFLRDKPDQVTGFKDNITNPWALFHKRLDKYYPELKGRAIEELKVKARKKRKWDFAIGTDDSVEGESGGFSFRFGGDDLEEE
ncbi:hypothetical protein MKZ38_007332 [Zalerion maritima]|uniref:Uncharacterized protein n=1 Tax=Zalerion maritima TaxID=339359 RepID=A0AAD5RVP9_9PEZI|nr:hypothetical protein MKZ38_007332 [Zalerion maritima]